MLTVFNINPISTIVGIKEVMASLPEPQLKHQLFSININQWGLTLGSHLEKTANQIEILNPNPYITLHEFYAVFVVILGV